jgi:hypothetical protein
MLERFGVHPFTREVCAVLQSRECVVGSGERGGAQCRFGIRIIECSESGAGECEDVRIERLRCEASLERVLCCAFIPHFALCDAEPAEEIRIFVVAGRADVTREQLRHFLPSAFIAELQRFVEYYFRIFHVMPRTS